MTLAEEDWERERRGVMYSKESEVLLLKGGVSNEEHRLWDGEVFDWLPETLLKTAIKNVR